MRPRPIPVLLLALLAACNSELPSGGPPRADIDFCPADAGAPPAHQSGPSAGCASSGQPTGVLILTTVSNGVDGILTVPPPAAAGTPLPLILVFHGAGEDAASIRSRYGLEGPADGGAVLAYLDSTASTWALGETVDLHHVDALVQEVSAGYCIDQDRIFAAGMSAGGVFTHWVGCVRSETFRAVAVTAGTDVRFDTSCCSGTMSAIMIHGMADTTITYAQGQAARNRLLATDGCSTTPVLLDANCTDYPGCRPGLAIEWCGHSGDHVIPPWAGGEVWSFFQRFP
jgi:polyhydroxybutyrate depolymerase